MAVWAPERPRGEDISNPETPRPSILLRACLGALGALVALFCAAETLFMVVEMAQGVSGRSAAELATLVFFVGCGGLGGLLARWGFRKPSADLVNEGNAERAVLTLAA